MKAKLAEERAGKKRDVLALVLTPALPSPNSVSLPSGPAPCLSASEPEPCATSSPFSAACPSPSAV